nr:deoxynucleotidyltransferase terminal-interacting protein 1 isoform X2 [Anolis sagrei ordinatus]
MTWQCGLIQSSPKQIIIWDQILGYRSSVDRASVKRGPFGKSWGQRTGSSGPSSNLCSGPKFFQKAAGNVRENTGEDLDTEQLIHETCRNCLEQAKLLFCDGKKSVARLPHEVPVLKRAKPADEDVSQQQGSPAPKKRKGRPPGQSQLSNQKPVAVNMSKTKPCEPVQREGPKWDPTRITESTCFVLGSRANKALGMGGTRGRLYIRHPHLFKYAADPQDKHWLAEQHHMRATGGKMVRADSERLPSSGGGYQGAGGK